MNVSNGKNAQDFKKNFYQRFHVYLYMYSHLQQKDNSEDSYDSVEHDSYSAEEYVQVAAQGRGYYRQGCEYYPPYVGDSLKNLT